jgi:hypothetical protein
MPGVAGFKPARTVRYKIHGYQGCAKILFGKGTALAAPQMIENMSTLNSCLSCPVPNFRSLFSLTPVAGADAASPSVALYLTFQR